ncbi:Periplasmic copper-binding protein (NosD) [Candidatus Methanoperedenaceae archaeon GB37]|nr:Periplasmic copper-binding protein (NosD) [Candidatus Methanoperedenaceae archaeon GB37]
MKRAIITGLGFSILLLAGCGGAGATEIWVPDDHTSIQDAVYAASSGDTIIVRDGTYHENVDVNVNHLTIRSENGSGSTTVVGSIPAAAQALTADSNGYGFNGLSDHVFDITADYVNISGFTVTGATIESKSKAGIYIHGTTDNPALNNSIKNCTAIKNDAGIYLKGAGVKYCVIENNTCSENEYGLRIVNAKKNDIKHNSFITNEYGIHLSNGDYNNISCNYIFNNRCGIYFKSRSTENIIECNNIIANGEYNETSGGYEWQFYNDQEEDVSATNNWWGTADNDEINASIYDWEDNPEKGDVTYLPKLGGPSSCAEIPEPVTLVMVTIGLLSLIGILYRSGVSGR